MTKMAAMPIYGKTFQKSSPEPVDRFQRNQCVYKKSRSYDQDGRHMVKTLQKFSSPEPVD